MTLNIFYGGDEWKPATGHWCTAPAGCPETLGQVAATIRAADPDVVGLQEGTANECRLADMLGWFCEPRLQLISRFPLIGPPGANGVYALAEVAPGRFIALSNVHLPSDPYGPYWVRDGEPRSAVLALERSTRLPAIQRQLDVLPGLAAAASRCSSRAISTPRRTSTGRRRSMPSANRSGIRWSGPFRRRWPARVSATRTERSIRIPSRCPGSRGRRPGTLESVPDEVYDRIDWVLVQGPAETLGTELVGEAGGPDVDVERDPYPTDHRGVVSTFRVTPATRIRSQRSPRGACSSARI